MNTLRNISIIYVILMLTSCVTGRDISVIECRNPRPVNCDQAEVGPVCASRDTGLRCVRAPCPGARTNVTYKSACDACMDKKVFSYTAGACENK